MPGFPPRHLLRFHARRILCYVLVVFGMLAGPSACFSKWGNSLGKGLVTGVKAQDDSLTAMGSEIAAAAVRSLAREYADSVRPQLEGTVRTAMADLNRGADSLKRNLATFVAGDLNRSVETLIRANTGVLRHEIDGSLDRWTNRILITAEDRLVLLASNLADTAMGSAVARLELGLRDQLRPVVLDIVREIRAEVDTITTTATTSVSRLLWIVLGIVATLVIGVTVIVYIRYRKSRRSLAVVTRAIEDMDRETGEPLKQRIEAEATAAKVEPWLRGFLIRQGIK